MLHHLDPVHLVDLMRIKFPKKCILIFIGGIYDGSKAGTMESVSLGSMGAQVFALRKFVG